MEKQGISCILTNEFRIDIYSNLFLRGDEDEVNTLQKNSLIVSFHEWHDWFHKWSIEKNTLWDTPVAVGKWTVRELVSHMMRWDRYFWEGAISLIISGEEKQLQIQHLDFDIFNEAAREHAHTISIEELVQETLQYREQIIRALHELPAEDWTKEYKGLDGGPFTVQSYVEDFIWHDRHHMKQLEDMSKPL